MTCFVNQTAECTRPSTDVLCLFVVIMMLGRFQLRHTCAVMQHYRSESSSSQGRLFLS